jgi:hypothetical protein
MQMRILYLLFILLFTTLKAAGQERLDNWQWAEWEQTAKHLESGEFNSAIAICKLYPRNQGFTERLKQIQNLKQLYSEGEQQQKSGRYLEAIAIYKKHRSLSGVGSLTVFEKKIDECVAKMGTPNVARLKTLERQVFAAELLFRAQRKLDQQNSSGALKDFTQAKTVIGNVSGNIKTQIERGLAATNEFIAWERQYQLAKKNSISKEQERDLLVELGYIPMVKIPALNRRLATLIEEIEGKNSIEEAVRNCEIERLVENLASIKPSANAEIAGQRQQFKSIYNKIYTLRSNRRNDSTIFSGYKSLSALVKAFPIEIQNGIGRCIDEGRLAALKAFREQALADNDRTAVASYNKAIAKETGTELEDVSRCEGIETFNAGLAKVSDLLSKCNPKEAQQLWSELEKSADCDEKRLLLKMQSDLGRKITDLLNADRRYNALLNEAKKAVVDGKYADAKAKYIRLSEMGICDAARKEGDVNNGLDELRTLEGKQGISVELVAGAGANKPLYKVNSDSRPLNYGVTFGAGFQFAYVNPGSPADLVLGVEYLSTSYYSADNSGYSIEKFTVSGVSGSLAIKVNPFKKKKWRVTPYFKIGFEGTAPVSNQYESYSSVGGLGNSDQMKKFLPSVIGAPGVEFKVGKTYLFLEAMGSLGVQSIFERNQNNGSGPANREVDARFRRATVRVGVKLY